MKAVQKVSMGDYSSLRIGGISDMVVINNEDELIEVTPNHIRLRKKVLDPTLRKRLKR